MAEGVSLARRATCEATGTAILLTAIIGSAIMAQRLAAGDGALSLLANALATGGALLAVIAAFGPYSGGHFNPLVTLSQAWQGNIPWRGVPVYILAQLAGAVTGVAIADLMFGAQVFSETVATFGLVATISCCSRRASGLVPFAVPAYIMGAYWFTSSTSFANPAVTIARSLSDSFAGIRPVDVPMFILAQIVGAAAATLLFQWLDPALVERSA